MEMRKEVEPLAQLSMDRFPLAVDVLLAAIQLFHKINCDLGSGELIWRLGAYERKWNNDSNKVWRDFVFAIEDFLEPRMDLTDINKQAAAPASDERA
jgi:hypothetical protein